MQTIGLIREGKTPADNRVALTPTQCKGLQKNFPHIRLMVQHSPHRCFSDAEYKRAGIEVIEDISECDLLIGIKEVPISQLVPQKTYMFFSHTKKKQPHNQKLLSSIISNEITLIDYESLAHEDGQRIIGFGFFAGIVGAHNGMMAYGKRTGAFKLCRVHEHKTFRKLLHTYFGLTIPNIKIAVTGSGRVAQGILEVMNLMQIREVEKEEYLDREFTYPVYVHLKGSDLYQHKELKSYNRIHFHSNPSEYECTFAQYAFATDVLMNGVYWDKGVPRLFERALVQDPNFRIQVIADVTDDEGGSVPINLGDGNMQEPVYGVDKKTLERTTPFLLSSVDIMAVSNLPNELPRDASRYFGEQMIKHILPPLISGGAPFIEQATIVKRGKLTEPFNYLANYAAGL